MGSFKLCISMIRFFAFVVLRSHVCSLVYNLYSLDGDMPVFLLCSGGHFARNLHACMG